MTDGARGDVDEVRPSDALEERSTELGNARRLVRLAGQDLRYVHPWKRWIERPARLRMGEHKVVIHAVGGAARPPLEANPTPAPGGLRLTRAT